MTAFSKGVTTCVCFSLSAWAAFSCSFVKASTACANSFSNCNNIWNMKINQQVKFTIWKGKCNIVTRKCNLRQGYLLLSLLRLFCIFSFHFQLIDNGYLLTFMFLPSINNFSQCLKQRNIKTQWQVLLQFYNFCKYTIIIHSIIYYNVIYNNNN